MFHRLDPPVDATTKNMNQPIISVSGFRGIIGDSLHPEMVMGYVNAFVSSMNERGPIIVARDGRSSGPMISQAVQSAIRAGGHEVLNAHIAATPTCGVLVRDWKGAGGIQITASHNPQPYNGLKLFGADGRVISAALGIEVLNRFRSLQRHWVGHDHIGDVIRIADTTSGHLSRVLATVDVAAIQKQRYKVILDSNRGAGSILGRALLEHLECDYQIWGDQPDGQFEHPPEPTADHLASTVRRARSMNADVVFCQDPDADRLAIIDETGRYIGEEYTLAITVARRLAQNPGPVVVNCATSRMVADIAKRYQCPLRLSAVGEANVTEMMIDEHAVFGGEGNGGPIDPQVGFVRDSFVAMAQVLDAMAASHKSISQLVSDIPRYQIVKSTISISPDKVAALFQRLQQELSSACVNHMDGLRLDWEDRWLLVRPSNTEPLVRAIAEASEHETARQLCQLASDLAQQI